MMHGRISIDSIPYFDTAAVSPAESASFVHPLQARKKDSIIINMGSPQMKQNIYHIG